MRRIGLWMASTVAAVVLLFSYSTSTAATMQAASDTPVISSSTPATGSSSGSNSASRSSAPSASTTTYTGSAMNTRYGPVQVQISVSGSQIAEVAVLQYPNSDSRDQEINSRALPVLVQETMDAQSANIDMVSGATYTSDGYIGSLQDALDQAGL